MGKRSMAAALRQKDLTDRYIRDAAGTGGSASELEKAKGLLDSGAIEVRYSYVVAGAGFESATCGSRARRSVVLEGHCIRRDVHLRYVLGDLHLPPVAQVLRP